MVIPRRSVTEHHVKVELWDISKIRPYANNPRVNDDAVELFARPMRKHTRPGDLCYEPFSGSGSQIIAAEQMGRRCRAIEISPAFCDVAVRRWEEFTGTKAERVPA